VRAALLLAALYLALALHGLGGADIVGDDEAREAGIVQDVVAGHVVWPRFNGELLPDKPLLFHWLAAVPCAGAGFSETAVRLPSALAGAALVAWTAHFGTELFGRPAGLVAAALLGTMPALFTRARVARPDVLLVLLLAAALGFAFRWWRDGRRHAATAALALLGAATLAKGPVAPVLFAVTLGGFLVWQREWRRLPAFFTGPGVVAFLVLGLGWYAAALGGWGMLFVREHLLGRYLRNLAGGLVRGAPYSPRPLSYHLLFYVKHLPAIALPWTPVTVVALWQAWRHDGLRDPRWRFLLCWVAAPVIVFTPAEWKLRHYLLPAVPALALVTAPGLLDLWQRPAVSRGRVHRLAAALVVLAALLGVATVATDLVPLSRSDRSTVAAVGSALERMPGGSRAAVAVAATVAGAMLVATLLRGWKALVALAAAGTIAWMAEGALAVEEQVNRHDSLKAFAAVVAARYPPPAEVAFYGDPIRSLVVYLGRHVPSVSEPGALTPGQGVITTDEAYRVLAAAARVGPPLLSAEGRVGNLRRGRIVLAEVISPPDASPLLPREHDGTPVDIPPRPTRLAGERRGDPGGALAGGAGGADPFVERRVVDPPRSRRCAGDHDGDLSAEPVDPVDALAEVRQRAAQHLLVPLGELARDHRLAITQRGLGGRQEGGEPARGLEEDEGPWLAGEGGEPGRAGTRPGRQEPFEEEAVGGQPRDRDERRQRRRTRDRDHRHARRQRSAHQVIARVGEAGRARIGDQGDRGARLQPLDDQGSPPPLHGVVVAGERPLDPVPGEENARAAGVLGRDQIDFAQHAERTQRDILEVPDGGGNHVENPVGHLRLTP